MGTPRLLSPMVLTAVCLCSASCGREITTSQVIVETRDGVTHVYSPDAPAWGLQARPFELVEVLGADLGGGAVTFGEPMTVAVDQTGRRFILDRQEPAVFVFDDGGSYLGTIGRGGEGPGEYSRPTDLLFLDDGSLAVLDPGSFRITRFDEEGNFLGQVSLSEYLSQFEKASEGMFFTYPRSRAPTLRILPNELEKDSAQISVLGIHGEPVSGFGPRQRLTGEMMDVYVTQLFLAALPGDTLVLNYQCLDQTEVWSPRGELVRVMHRPLLFGTEAPEYGEEDRGPGLRPLTGSAWDVLSSGLATHPDGRYWAVLAPLGKARFRTPMFGEPEIPDAWAIDLFDSQGLWLARQPVDFPATYAVLDWHDDGLYLVNRQEDAAVYRFAFHPVGASRGPGRRGGRP